MTIADNVLTTENLMSQLEVPQIVEQTIVEAVVSPVVKPSKKTSKPKKKLPLITIPKTGDKFLKVDENSTTEYTYDDTFITDDDHKLEVVSIKKANKFSDEGFLYQAFFSPCVYKEEYYDSKKKLLVTGKTFTYTPSKDKQSINVEVTNKDNKQLKGYTYKFHTVAE